MSTLHAEWMPEKVRPFGFIDPFGYEDSGASTNLCYDDLEVDLWDEFEPEPDVYLEAYDLRTFCEEGDTYIFTSWRQSRIDSGASYGSDRTSR